MTEDDKEVRKIMNMNITELIDYLFQNPEYLTDSYYCVFATAMHNRYKELRRSLT